MWEAGGETWWNQDISVDWQDHIVFGVRTLCGTWFCWIVAVSAKGSSSKTVVANNGCPSRACLDYHWRTKACLQAQGINCADFSSCPLVDAVNSSFVEKMIKVIWWVYQKNKKSSEREENFTSWNWMTWIANWMLFRILYFVHQGCPTLARNQSLNGLRSNRMQFYFWWQVWICVQYCCYLLTNCVSDVETAEDIWKSSSDNRVRFEQFNIPEKRKFSVLVLRYLLWNLLCGRILKEMHLLQTNTGV